MIDVRSARLVGEREIREQLRGRALWISTGVAVVAVVLIVVLPHALGGGRPTYRIAVAGSTATLDATVEAATRSAGAEANIEHVPDGAAAVAAVQAKGPEHASIGVDATGTGRVIIDRELPANSTTRKALVVNAIARALGVEAAVRASGLTPQAAHALTDAQPVPVEHLRPAPSSEASRGVAVVGAIVFYILALRYGYGLLMGVAQEKSTRVIEVILSAVRPIELLTGKILGSAVVVLAQAGVLVATALVSSAAVGSDVLAGNRATAVVVAFLWVVIGFLLYASLFAAAGALASKTEDAQSVSLPLQIPLFVGYFASFTALGNGSPNAIVTVLAYIPFTAPMDMPVLAATGGAGPLGVAISMLLTVATIVLTTRVAAAIFRRSILRTGQRVRMVKLVREMRRERSTPEVPA